ncbi:hypothetical protein Agabi119p4_5443 [Agaricus bisporus var. burnettii]|uniref:Repressor of RNA polymerase III transcription MAF1 n=1 Tax=Agaricus bisporus var. burnettii TaxID=192524 RepID=A0A8H7KGH4_AGABI|nr:hypothetical protein Agabi119p4_5443 [Agaricus bisporus var. burnettii]
MKYIENPALARLAQSLTHEGPECSVHTRMEAYSCKNIKRDKKLFKTLESAYKDEVSNSPPLPSWLSLDQEAEMTPFGPIDKHASRKTLYLLIATLNIAFPDYEFSDVRPSHFVREQNAAGVLNALSNTLVSPQRAGLAAPRSYSSYPPAAPDIFPPPSNSPYNQVIPSPLSPPPIVSGTHPALFRLIDEVIGLSDCEVFSYTPEIEADPHANDFSDEEEDTPSTGEEESSSDDDATFEFDNYDIDEVRPPSDSRFSISVLDSAHSEDVPHHNAHGKPRGVLLWSSHWFFLNRKLRRILYISVWARSRGMGRSWNEDEYEAEPLSSSFSESLSKRYHCFLVCDSDLAWNFFFV